MNFKTYEKWLRQKLIPNFPNSVSIIDNAPYHNKQVNPTPTSDDIIMVMQKSIPHGE
jgi:hypothetical protein